MAVVETKHIRPRSRGGQRIAAMLDQLRRQAFHVLQDVELTDEGSIEYLVLGPTGVFTIATERHLDGAMLETARRKAARLEAALGVTVTPVICPPGRQGHEPFVQQDVWIVRRDDLVLWLAAQQNEVLEFVRFPQLAQRL